VRFTIASVVLLTLFALVACSSTPTPVVQKARMPTPLVLRIELISPRPTTTPTRSIVAAIATTAATDAPTASPSPTPFLTPPPAGEAALIPILMYHHLQTLGQNPTQAERDWTVAPKNFTAQLDYLAAHGYRAITFAQLVAFFEQGAPLPLHPVMLTFDDGWLDDYTVAFPALRAHVMVGTFFVPTMYADAGGKALMNWTQIAEMDAAGMEFGGHTLNHANLTKVSAQEAQRQLQASKLKLEQKLGHTTIAFAYPFGATTPAIMRLVQQAGYQVAVGLCCSYRLRADGLLFLPRIRISYDDTLEDFAKKLPPLTERHF
jgi:peptidoglycan/xylan/chitin deacetylase (PgdA/CDA1 family)